LIAIILAVKLRINVLPPEKEEDMTWIENPCAGFFSQFIAQLDVYGEE
jgi:hypothetical protein